MVADRLASLAAQGWTFQVDGERLRYRAPREGFDAADLEWLKTNKSAVLRALAGEEGRPEVHAPLSHGQRALWFLWKLAPSNPAYHQSLPVVVRDDADAWRAACGKLIARHPMLRCVFPLENGAPLQRVTAPGQADFAVLDAPDALEARMVREHNLPFDLENGPVARFRLFRQNGGRAVLLVTLHHIVCDGWSFEIIRRELPMLAACRTYHPRGKSDRLLAEGVEPPPPAATYFDYVRRRAELLRGDEGEALWVFWRGKLSGAPPAPNLPADHPRVPLDKAVGEILPLRPAARVLDAFGELARRHTCTMHTALLAAFAAFLHQATGARDLIIGTPSANRDDPDFAGVVGYFVDMLPVRLEFDPAEGFSQLLAVARREVSLALKHHAFPFPLLVEKLAPPRDPCRSPVFDFTFNHARRVGLPHDANFPPPEILPLPQAAGKFDLTLDVVEEDEIRMRFACNAALFNKETRARLAGDFCALLEAVAAHPDTPLAALAARGRPVPVMAGRTVSMESRNLTVAEMFAVRAGAAPGALALVAKDGEATYGDLAVMASTRARQLCAAGVKAGEVVGLAGGRHIQTIAALLGILEVGAVCLPLDPRAPAAWLRGVLEQAKARHVFADASAAAAIPAEAVLLPLDDAPKEDAGPVPPPQPAPDGAAMLIFTSGSTGKPKGVVIEHHALANYAAGVMEECDLRDGRFAHVSTLAADLGHTMLFGALCSGGTLVLLPEEAMTDPGVFADWMRRHRADHLKIAPSHLAALTGDGGDLRDILPRRTLILGGEPSRASWIESLRRSGAPCAIYNHYGPTEATVGVLIHKVPPEPVATPSGNLPLDRVLPNCRAVVLDGSLQPVPRGVAGELFLGGVCLARGYLGDEAATSKAFVKDPARPDERLHRTGDLARILADGKLELLGRADRQIKIRGFRVEPGQIESALLGHPAVSQCHVTLSHGMLTAFAAPSGGLSEHEAAEFLAGRLPPAMVPARFVFLDALPVTANGKLDAAALRRADPGPSMASAASLPRDTVEARLRAVWAELLGGREPGIDEDFFAVGGHSLLAVRLAWRIREVFGRAIPMAVLLREPTIAGISRHLRAGAEAPGTPEVLLRRAKGDVVLCLFPGAGGNVLYFQELVSRLRSDVTVFGMQGYGVAEGEQPPTRVEESAARYAALLPTLADGRRLALAGHSFGALLAWETACLLTRAGAPPFFTAVLDNPATGSGAERGYENWDDGQWLAHITTRIGLLYGVALPVNPAEISGLPPGEAAASVARLMKRAGLLPPDTESRFFARFMELYKANALAALRYMPSPLEPPPFRFTVFRARDTNPTLGPSSPAQEDAALGWGAFCANQVETVPVPGDHLGMLRGEAAGELARALEQRLAGA